MILYKAKFWNMNKEWKFLFDTFVTHPMQEALTFFYVLTQKAGYPSYGIAIILLTVAIKLLMYPLTVKNVK